MARIVYSRRYNIGFFGLERLHPFDSRKYGRAWGRLRRHFGRQLNQLWVLQRDLYVVGELRRRGIPTVMVLSGGYTKQSYQLVADSVIQLLEVELAANS